MDIMNDKTETTLGDSLSSAQCLWAGNKVGNDADRIKDYINTHIPGASEAKATALISIFNDTDDGIYIHQPMMTFYSTQHIVYILLFDASLILDTKPLKELTTSALMEWNVINSKSCPPIFHQYFVNDYPLDIDNMYCHDIADCLTVCSDLLHDHDGFMKLIDIFLHKYSKHIMHNVYSLAFQNIQNIEFKSIVLKLINEYDYNKEEDISL